MQPQRILVPRRALDSGDESDAADALIAFVDALRGQLWRVDELPSSAVKLYHADAYVTQAASGGHAAFFHDAAPRARAVRWARAGLVTAGALDLASVLDRAVALITGDPRRVERLDEPAIAAAIDDVAPAFAALDEAVLAMAGPWTARVAAWLVRSPEVLVLDDDAYAWTMDALRDAVPERRRRESSAPPVAPLAPAATPRR